MGIYNLKVNSPILGGYFSSMQIDLLSIIQCQSIDELIKFVARCDQINNIKGIFESLSGLDLESAKRSIFKKYQDTLVYHDEELKASRNNRINYLGLSCEEEFMTVIDKTNPISQKILSLNHHFISEEWDQIKTISYEEMQLLNSHLSSFNSMLIGSGKIYKVINKYDINQETKYDFYFARRDLDFAYKNGKQVRFHSLLVKDHGKLFYEKSKEEIIKIIKDYVKESIDFVKEYNYNHKIIKNGKEEPIINAIDLFNEIVSFEKMIFDKETNKWYEYKKIDGNYKVVIDENNKIYRDLKEGEIPEYQNIWLTNYGITMPELMSCFEYALTNKPEGVSYLYNEPFLENDERRSKVFETLNQTTPGLIDTIGYQMHIPISQDLDSIKRCFADLKKLHDRGINIQVTEFDMCLNKDNILRVFGENPDITLERVYQEKDKKILEISHIINSLGIDLKGITYWSLTDGIDCNLERIRTTLLKQGKIRDIKDIPTACGGLIPTHKKFIKNNDKSNNIKIT